LDEKSVYSKVYTYAGQPNLKQQKYKDCDGHCVLHICHYFLTYVHTQVILLLAYCPYFEKIKVGAVKPVLNGISKVQNIFLLKPGFRLVKVYYNN
jgi:hypothetical protein